MTTVRQAIVNFTPIEPVNFGSPTRLHNLAYFCTPLESVTDEYVLITSATEVDTYTSDTRIKDAFTNGLNQVYLAFDGNITDYTELSNLAYTLVCSPETDTVSADFSTFEGIKVYTQENPESLTLPTEDNVPEKLAAIFKNCVFYAKEVETLAIQVLSNMISESDNPNWNSLQLRQYGSTTALCNGDDVLKVREKQLSSTASDNDVPIATLIYLRAGGYNLADYYIVENLRQDIQTATMNYIANTDPRYDNKAIGQIIAVGQSVINNYIDRGLIEEATYTIPPRQEQTAQDIISGLLNYAELTITISGAIWAVKGTVTYILGEV